MEETAVIWDSGEGITYFVLGGDLRKFHEVYVGDAAGPTELQEELESVMFHGPDPVYENAVSLEDFVHAIRQGAHAIECGQLP